MPKKSTKLLFEEYINRGSPENVANWPKEKLDQELEKGYAGMLAGRTKSAALYISEAKKKYKG